MRHAHARGRRGVHDRFCVCRGAGERVEAVLDFLAFRVLPVGLTALGAGLALWAWATGNDPVPALVIAVVLMGVAQVLLLFADSRAHREASRRARSFMRMFSALRRDMRRLSGRIGRLEQTAGAGRPEHPRPAARRAPATSGGARPLRDFRLYMEPVADLEARRTVLYRATPALAAEGARIHLGPQALLRAGRGGFAPDLDLLTIREAGAFLRRLHARGREVSLICPVSGTSLASGRFRAELGAQLKALGPLARRLTIDISHGTLSGLEDESAAGLVWLARSGAPLCLSDCRPEKTDAEALAQLGFVFLDMDARVIARALGGRGGEALRRRFAASGLTIIASGVDSREAEALARVRARLARGRLISPPRRVRMTAGAERKERRRSAA